MNKDDFNKLIKEAINKRLDSAQGMSIMRRIHFSKKHENNPDYKDAFKEGEIAAKTGISSVRNPYIGNNSIRSRAWYDGWNSIKQNISRIKEYTLNPTYKDDDYSRAYVEGVEAALEGKSKNENPYMEDSWAIDKKITPLIKGWNDGWDSVEKLKSENVEEEQDNRDIMYGDKDTHHGMINMKGLHDQIEFQKAYAEGIEDARNKIPRNQNPYLGTQSILRIKGWNGGWDFWNGLKGRNIKEEFDDTDTIEGDEEIKDLHKKNLIKSFDFFTGMYVDVALATCTDNSNDSGGEPLDRNYNVKNIDYKTLERMIKDCKDFQRKYEELYSSAGWDDGKAAYDFWLTRNGHGAGFWDRDSSTLFSTELRQRGGEEAIEEVRKQLTKASKSYGEYDLYVGEGNFWVSSIKQFQ